MAPPLIQLKDIKLTFGGTPLLSGVELSVSQSERVCLIGRNGSGKSTLLKIAAGLVEPDSGSRFVQPGATIRYLPQEPDFGGFATTLAYVEAGLGPGDDRHQARYVLEQLGLRGDEDPAQLSGGEGRRVALARVLAPSPDILLLDEPTNHLDLTSIEWPTKRRLNFNEKHALETLPKTMAKLQAEIARQRRHLDDPNLFQKDRKKFDQASDALAKAQRELEAAEDKWLELEVLREEIEQA
jgi:ATPase subunit of ABC transporter with duplicated ATPase domains